MSNFKVVYSKPIFLEEQYCVFVVLDECDDQFTTLTGFDKRGALINLKGVSPFLFYSQDEYDKIPPAEKIKYQHANKLIHDRFSIDPLDRIKNLIEFDLTPTDKANLLEWLQEELESCM